MRTNKQQIEDGVESVKSGLAWMNKTFPGENTIQGSYSDWAGEYPMPQWLLTGVAEKLNLIPELAFKSPDFDQHCKDEMSFNY